ncbi:hypothetical protein NPIL_378341 [Nephila pilipes]|uniref:Uncharacterized protein n=1 Tax=Nephila pilipes TaxID=299642 RepID=A0A8X6Q6A2_NEPPI|nr:hypothetical protein NPIL_378341 [Nephila pilipes]
MKIKYPAQTSTNDIRSYEVIFDNAELSTYRELSNYNCLHTAEFFQIQQIGFACIKDTVCLSHPRIKCSQKMGDLPISEDEIKRQNPSSDDYNHTPIH